ncbi:hypothetical protein [Acetivibrio straminisolvens]|jgi:hypothetical protein|nr:hypothetical protein [Acetivibrio straminisolvens]
MNLICLCENLEELEKAIVEAKISSHQAYTFDINKVIKSLAEFLWQ